MSIVREDNLEDGAIAPGHWSKPVEFEEPKFKFNKGMKSNKSVSMTVAELREASEKFPHYFEWIEGVVPYAHHPAKGQ